ncbi:pro-resilin-like [Penaeus vannamei]|uniref:pro-resilin-like n=1 Tax=Penaeus vannamei TaxID=6689 RepID=UPI00387FA077
MGVVFSSPSPASGHRRPSATSPQADQIFLLAALAGAAITSPEYLRDNDIFNHKVLDRQKSLRRDPALPRSPAGNVPYLTSPGYSLFARAPVPPDSPKPITPVRAPGPTSSKPVTPFRAPGPTSPKPFTPFRAPGLTSRPDTKLKHHSPSLKPFAPSSNTPKSLPDAHKTSNYPRPAHANRHRAALAHRTLPPPSPPAGRALVAGSPLPRGAVPEQGKQPDRQYSIQYAVRDESSGNNFGHQEDRDGYRTQGLYYVELPDNRVQKVTYYVDGKSGFVAQVTYERKTQYSP